MIDWIRVSELRDEIGPEDFREVVDIFLEEVDAATARLGDGTDHLEAQLHFLKGSALNLGFSEFARLCQLGEAKAVSEPQSIDLNEIRQCYASSRAAFLSGMNDHSAA